MSKAMNDQDKTWHAISEIRARITALEAEERRPPRFRVNVSTTSKGLPSIDVTVDGQDSGADRDWVMEQVDMMVGRMMAKYPAETPL